MKNILLILGIAATGLFWACGDGTIATKTGDDEIALLNYGEFNPEGMKGLVGDALKACQEDPKCAEAMERAGVVSSSSDSTSTDSLTSGSSAGANSAGSSAAASAGSSGTSGSSAGAAGSSSSGAVSSSSGSVVSSSSAMLVSSSSLTPATNVDGVCAAAVNPFTGLGKNTPTTWSFTNTTTATAETYDWTFDDGASIEISTDATPSVSYSTAGTHVAKLIVNKGKSSASKEITCTSIVVTGTRPSGCECTTTTTGTIDVSKDNPQSVTWTVSGCNTSDGSELTYTWEEGVTANGTSATKSISTGGTHAPKVTVTAESDTVVTCQAVTATAPATANCYLSGDQNEHWQKHETHDYSTAPGGSFYFAPIDVEGSTEAGISMDVTVNGSSTPITVKWGNATAATKLTAPAQEGEFPVTLSHNGRDVCSAMLTVAYPKITSTSCSINGSNKFSPGSSFNGWVGDDNLSMDFYRDDTKLTSLTVNRYYNGDLYTVTMPTTAGTYNFRLVYQGNEVCKITKTVALVETSCNIGPVGNASGSNYTAIPGRTFAFKPGNSTHPGGATRSMSLEFNGTTQTIEVKPNGNNETTLEVPATPDTYPLTLKYEANTICTATLKAEYPAITASDCAIEKNVWNSGKDFFTPGSSFNNWSNDVGSPTTMTLYMDETLIGSANVTNGYNTPQWMQVTLPTDGEQHAFVLKYGNRTVCKVNYTN